MTIHPSISDKFESLRQLCIRFGVDRLYVFGSVVNERFEPETSDIDLLVELSDSDPVSRGEKLLELWDELESLFGRKVDLLSNPEIDNPYLRHSIDRTKVLLYDGSSQKILV